MAEANTSNEDIKSAAQVNDDLSQLTQTAQTVDQLAPQAAQGSDQQLATNVLQQQDSPSLIPQDVSFQSSTETNAAAQTDSIADRTVIEPGLVVQEQSEVSDGEVSVARPTASVSSALGAQEPPVEASMESMRAASNQPVNPIQTQQRGLPESAAVAATTTTPGDATGGIFTQSTPSVTNSVLPSAQVNETSATSEVTTVSGTTPTTTPANADPTTAGSLSSVTSEGSAAYTVNLLSGASDSDGGALNVSGVTYRVDGGAASTIAPIGVSLSGNVLSVDPTNANFENLAAGDTRDIQINYTIGDGQSGSVAQSLTVTITGTNDAAVISGTSSAGVTESNAQLTTGGTLSASDVDGSAAFVAQSNVTGSNGYGSFGIGSDGVWTYQTSGPQNQLAAGQSVTDSFTVATADGTSQIITVTITGTNDAAVISGTSSAGVTESNAQLTTGGTLSASDVDGSAAFVAQSNVTGSNGYGSFGIGSDGVWTYQTSGPQNQLAAGQSVTDSFTVATADGTSQIITVTITGTNDAAVISGTSSAGVTESNAQLTTGGTLSASDVDGSAAFVAQSNVTGSNGYGSFGIGSDGVWTYQTSGPQNQLAAGQSVTDSFTVATADGTSQIITVTITGTNDAAVISGTSSAGVTESNAQLTTGGTLSASDVDGSAAFVAQSNVTGSNGYGSFGIGSDGVWTYQTSGPQNQLAAGQSVTDSFTVATADGTSQIITVTITGTNDAAVISGTSSAGVTESNAQLTTGGTLSASDVDGSAAFVAQSNVTGSNGYGSFGIGSDGVWTYQTSGPQNQLAAGQSVTDSFTVATADGTSQIITVTITGTNDAAVISGTSSAGVTESNAQLTTGGTLSASDVDGSAAFVAQSNVTGSNGYGSFGIGSDGVWTYQTSGPQNQLAAGQSVTDSFTVATADGTSQIITVTITGTNDAAVISGTSSAGVTESNAQLTTGGTLSASDVDGSAAFVAQSNVTGSNGYGSFGIGSDGVWTYQTSGPQNQLAAGQSVTDSFTVATADGTSQIITVTITGTNDGPTINQGVQSVQLVEAGTGVTGAPNATITVTHVDPEGTASSFDTTWLAANGWNKVGGGATYTSTGTYGTATLTIATGQVSYALNNTSTSTQGLTAGQMVADDFTVQVTDGAATTQGIVSFSITGSNDAPVVSGSATLVAVPEDSGARVITQAELLGTSSDVEAGTLTATGLTISAGNGLLVNNGNGTWTYTPAANDDTSATFAYTVSDASGGTAPATATLDLTAVNDPPTVSVGVQTAQLIETGAGVAGTASATITLTKADVEGSATFDTAWLVANGWTKVGGGATYTSTGTYGTATLTIATGQVSYALNNSGAATQGLTAGQSVADNFMVQVTDTSATAQALVSFNITGSNDAPAVTTPTVLSYTDTSTFGQTFTTGSGTLSASDFDNTSLVYDVTGGTVVGSTSTLVGNYGTFSINTSTGAYTYTPNTTSIENLSAGQNPTDSFTLTVNDGTATSQATLTVNLTGANETIAGTANADTLAGSGGIDTITGLAGVDNISAGAGADSITGGAGADILTGGAGVDTFAYTTNTDTRATVGGTGNAGTIAGYDVITDYQTGSTQDILNSQGTAAVVTSVATTNDSTLTIADATVKSHAISGGIMTFDDAATYAAPLNLSSTSDVAAVIQYLNNNDLGSTGSSVAFNANIDGTAHTYVFTQTGNNSGSNLGQVVDLSGVTLTSLSTSASGLTGVGRINPIALDLNDDGQISYLTQDAGVSYDYNQDGVKESTAWVGGQDGILAFQQADGTLKITFSNEAEQTDLEGVAQVYDVNQDGMLNREDGSFTSFGVWQDVDSDAIVDQGEFTQLNDLGINSINLVSDGQSFMLGDGEVVVFGNASFTNDDGSAGLLHDMAFQTNYDISGDYANATWTNVVDVAATSDPMISASGSGQVDLQGAAQQDGDWTVIVNSGDAVYQPDTNQIQFTTDPELNSVTIMSNDSVVQQISDVDKIQWTPSEPPMQS